MPSHEGSHDSTEELIRAGEEQTRHTSRAEAGSTRAALANALVGLMKQHYGRGPTAAKAWVLDDYVFVALENGLTRNEETLVADGKEEEVRSYRLAFQQTVAPIATRMVSEITGRRVLTYHSQIVFHPARAFEIFVLEPSVSA
ncbi:MAG TPA: Na-translocating system protein MpsC family protein [Solirubrobacteraceae bacterium]|nr:Na-translocating system protein MpsC family protein [Solirubrobacteraceae bacterium]